jgi:hypothetical protein
LQHVITRQDHETKSKKHLRKRVWEVMAPGQLPVAGGVDHLEYLRFILNISKALSTRDPWRNGSASDSRSEGCVFDSRRVQFPNRINIFALFIIEMFLS